METIYVFVALILGFVIRHALSSYLTEKGKNLATKEDINQITHIVESIKADFSKDLELLKWQLTKKANIHRIVAEREIQAVSAIGEGLWDLRIATTSLRPVFDRTPSDIQKKKEVFESRFAHWAEKHDAFLAVVEKHRLFLPAPIYSRLAEIKTLAVKEGVSFETELRHFFDDGFSFEQYEKARENTAQLMDAIEELSSVIIQRYEIEGLT